jgi:hypothetical protein
VIQQVGSFLDHTLAGLVFGGDDSFNRLFAELLHDFVDALFEQLRGIAAGRPLPSAIFDERIEGLDGSTESSFRTEARVSSGMACRAARFNLHKHRIGIAIQADGANLLSISRSLAFMPQRLAAAALEIRLAFFESQSQGFLVHIGNSENLPRCRVLYHGRDQATGVEFGIPDDVVLRRAHRTKTPIAGCRIGKYKRFNGGLAGLGLQMHDLIPVVAGGYDPLLLPRVDEFDFPFADHILGKGHRSPDFQRLAANQ